MKKINQNSQLMCLFFNLFKKVKISSFCTYLINLLYLLYYYIK